jgi:hypothetical protein
MKLEFEDFELGKNIVDADIKNYDVLLHKRDPDRARK